ncbi:MAG: DHH family phosphoesterase [Candidatus Micrarchaeota archaeon]
MIEGVVSRTFYTRGKREYILTDGGSDYGFFCDEHIAQGAVIRLEGEMGMGKIAGKKATVLEGDEGSRVLSKVRSVMRSSLHLPESPVLAPDDLTRRLWPAMMEAAAELIGAKKLGRQVLLRFHGDADGICGAFALTSVLPCRALQQNSAVYSVKDALRDMAGIGQEGRPLIMLLDFGSNDASAEALGLLKAGGIDCLVIDHHPYNAKKERCIINPFSIHDNASRYTAGYLACEIAAVCGLDVKKAMELAAIACSGDKSDLVPNGEAEMKKAMVLDFVASHVSFGNNLDFYRKVMENRELFSSIARQADESIGEAAAKAMDRMKKQEAGRLLIVSFSLEGIVKKGEWPSSSKITTRVFDNLSGERPLFCIGQTDRSLIMRLNGPAAALGLSANGMAEKMKKSMADFVEGGGGHVRAGAVRVRTGFAKEVLNQIVREASSTAQSGQG